MRFRVHSRILLWQLAQGAKLSRREFESYMKTEVILGSKRVIGIKVNFELHSFSKIFTKDQGFVFFRRIAPGAG